MSRLVVSPGVLRPINTERTSFQTVERKLNAIEIACKRDDLEIQGIIMQMAEMQRQTIKRFEANEKKWEKRCESLEKRCEVLEKTHGSHASKK